MPLFYTHYASALEEGVDLHLTEKHRFLSPVCIDLDFRRGLDTAPADGAPIRLYTQASIDRFIELYMVCLSEFVHLPACTKVYVMEKTQGSVGKDALKDGVHIMVPDVVTRASVQLLVRQQAVRQLSQWHAELTLSNSLEDVFDEAVIEKNNWLMYGSKKVGGEAYALTRVVLYEAGSIQEGSLTDPGEDLVRKFSIRNKFMESKTREEKLDVVGTYEMEELERRKAVTSAKVILQGSSSSQEGNGESMMPKDLDEIRALVAILKPERANNYNDWIRLGWCLRNIDKGLLDAWVAFSKKSPKYVEGECESRWNQMKRGGLGVGTLHMWAKQDNPEEYGNMMRESLRNLIMNSLTGTHHDVALVIYSMYKHEFVCASIKSRVWYIFKDHRWQLTDSGYILRARISNEVWYEYTAVSVWNQQKAMTSDSQVDQARYQEFAKKLIEVAQKLKNTTFKDNVMKECAELFYIERFEERLDANINLLGFENGIYDLDNHEFRDGRPEDYVSLCTRIHYRAFNPDDPRMDEIHKYLAQVLTNYEVRDYVLKLLASFLHGAIKDQKFYIWTGSGANSKSKLVELFEKAFGDYCCKFPITLLTQKRVASNAANSEVARARGRRFASLQEPSEDEKINIGYMKELSGGDKIMARSLFKEPIEFLPQFKMLLLCNHLPHVPSDDGGTWRRIRVVEFTSKFVDEPKGENEFPIDMNLSAKLESWKECFMSLLIEYYKSYSTEGMYEPEAVLKCTTDYKNQNDHIASFVAEMFERHPDSSGVTVSDIFAEFRAWVKSNGINARIPIKTEMEKIMSKHFGVQAHTHGGNRVFKGWRFKSHSTGDE